MVRAKFRVMSKTQLIEGHDVRLVPVHGGKSGSPENAEFYRYTPSGEITMRMISAAAADVFVPGAYLYVDFTPCPPESADGHTSG